MILSFKEEFNERILNGKKIHTIRKDKHERWHEGMKIHFANHIRTPNYKQFHSGICTGVQKIDIFPERKLIFVDQVSVNNFAIWANDGFTGSKDFWDWFSESFSGRLIHWTDYRY